MTSILDGVLIEYENIARAPTMADLEAQARDLKVSLSQLVAEERTKRYKAVDRLGVVFLIQNPAVWETDPVRKAKIMPMPIRQGKIQDLASGFTTSNSGKLKAAFFGKKTYERDNY